ncbi:MAG TPA: helix-turn-helix transcriptional regulator [Acholeplasmataceae bacterium]|nr:helix-turn-helix transcriptional regulator [Acholeplasmataceae bacterium]
MNNLVEKLRKDRGLNQEELSKALKVSRQTISAIENGKYNPSLDLAFTISDFFGLKIEEIFFPNKGGKRNEEK